MKYYIYAVNILLVILIPVVFIVTPVEEVTNKAMSIDAAIKQLPSEVLNVEDENDEMVDSTVCEENEEQDVTQVLIDVSDRTDTVSNNNSTGVDNSVEESTTEESKKEVLEIQFGKMSGYGPDCKGCSGYLASGKYVGDGTIYYEDPTYGSVRILAGDSTYKFGTIVRVSNSNAGSFIGIVLDRGGSIGIGKKYLFDLLYSNEQAALLDEVSYNVVFEVLRYGY